VYPNRYAVAMGNLGFQTVYELIDRHADTVCERAFLPEPERGAAPTDLRSFESGRPVAAFDLIAFSLSFESDYLNLLPLFASMGLEPRRERRASADPLVLAGGPAVFLNPEPIADLFDLFLIGEGEEMIPEFLDRYAESRARGDDRSGALMHVAERVRGAYVPARYHPEYDGPVLREVACEGPPRVQRRMMRDLNRFMTQTRVLSDRAVFGDMMLVEASRGCQWGCRFCAAGYMYRPLRTRGGALLAEAVRAGAEERAAVGLVGAEIASVPGAQKLAEAAAASGARLSPSSLKADCITPELGAALARCGTQSVTVAPEAGSERMRRVINKNLTEAEILRAAALLVDKGVKNLKLYFMIGLPTETAADVRAIGALAEKTRARLCENSRAWGRMGTVSISVNPFVPKPWTPFQWDGMEPIAALRAKTRELHHLCGRIPNVEIEAESPREAYLQTLLSRGDRRAVHFLEAVHEADGDWWGVIRRWRRDGLADLPPPDDYVCRTYDREEPLPWDFIDHGVEKRYLWSERRKALAGVQTPPCDTATCRTCGVCGEG